MREVQEGLEVGRILNLPRADGGERSKERRTHSRLRREGRLHREGDL